MESKERLQGSARSVTLSWRFAAKSGRELQRRRQL